MGWIVQFSLKRAALNPGCATCQLCPAVPCGHTELANGWPDRIHGAAGGGGTGMDEARTIKWTEVAVTPGSWPDITEVGGSCSRHLSVYAYLVRSNPPRSIQATSEWKHVGEGCSSLMRLINWKRIDLVLPKKPCSCCDVFLWVWGCETSLFFFCF